jgi:hypothetical protein
MFKVVSSNKMQFEQNGKSFDYDIYELEYQTQISTKQITIVVDFKNEEITGDIVAHGNWYDLTIEECLEYIEIIDKPIRNFDHIIDKNIRTYKVQVREILDRVVEVKAVSEQQAVDDVTSQYQSEKIILDSEDMIVSAITIYDDK